MAFFALLIALSAAFSGSETALTSMTKLRVKRLMTDEEGRYDVLHQWLEHPRRYLTTILIGNNVVNVGASILAAALTERIMRRAGVTDNSAYASAVAFLAVTFFLLTFGEILPKNYCKEHAPKISLAAIRPLDILHRFIRPFVSLFVMLSNLMIRATGGTTIRGVPVMTEDEVRSLINVSGREGVLEEDEREMINSIIDFGDTVVHEIMTPRVDIKGLDIEAHGLEDARRVVVDSGHSRIPVYEHDLDQVAGILYAKDLLSATSDPGKPPALGDLLRPCMFVPNGKRVSDLLQSFRSDKTHIAIVVDEYGGTAGIVTIEDVLEEIVGDIQDEYDSEQPMFRVAEDGAIIADAKVDLDDLESEFGIQLILPELEFEFETLGGFVTSFLGDVPSQGDEFTFEDLTITILESDARKVDRVRIVKEEVVEESEPSVPDGEQPESNGEGSKTLES